MMRNWVCISIGITFADSPTLGDATLEQFAPSELDELADASWTISSVSDSTSGRLFGSFVSRRRHFTQSRVSLVILTSWTLVTKSLDALPFFILNLWTLNGSEHDGCFAASADILPRTLRHQHWRLRLLSTPRPREDCTATWNPGVSGQRALTCSVARTHSSPILVPPPPPPILDYASPPQTKPSVSDCPYATAVLNCNTVTQRSHGQWPLCHICHVFHVHNAHTKWNVYIQVYIHVKYAV